MSELMHHGTPRHSGRYPWGSGKNPYQHSETVGGVPRHTGRFEWDEDDNPKGNENIVRKYDELKARGFTDAQIAEGWKYKSSGALRAKVYNAKNELKKEKMIKGLDLLEAGELSQSEIARQLDVTEGTVRNWKKQGRDILNRRDATRVVADELKKQVDSLSDNGYLDIGSGVEYSLGTNESRKKSALNVLEDEGYVVWSVQQQQQGAKKGQKTTIQVLCPPGTTYKDVVTNMEKIHTIENYEDAKSDISPRGLPPVESISSSRIKINYSETGGTEKDGVIELRRGLKDLNLGDAQYAQVRIAVDDKLYLKGMAMYKDNMPPGVDVIFNTNKSSSVPLEDVLKPMKTLEDGSIDKANPFGASIKYEGDLTKVPRRYMGDDGKEHVSPINVVNEEGDWRKWSKTIAAQMLSKQPLSLAKPQLELSYEIKRSQLDDILAVTNPVVKKKLLEGYASDCDANAVHLKAASFPRQAQKVILPVQSLKDNEIYAPGFKTGETVALVRYPHAGPFEIPILKVNNKNKEANSIMHNAIDAVGINGTVAAKLSGADFDGDSVVVIPTRKGGPIDILAKETLPGLKGFETKEYAIKNRKEREAAGEKLPKPMNKKSKQQEMGKISNLITDMNIKAASDEHLERAVKHSMVVIDALKHDLDYRQSAKDNNIEELKRLYQMNANGTYGGASTLLSRAKSQERVNTRREVQPTREMIESGEYTGEKMYKDIDKDTYIKNGVKKHREIISTQMAEKKDARELISEKNTAMEREYAKYANRLKALANEARKAYYSTENPKRDPAAAKAYSKEVESLNKKLEIAKRNAPRERQAQIAAGKEVEERLSHIPKNERDPDEEKKIKSQALSAARVKYGARKTPVDISPREWEAIQSHAIGSTNLRKILDNADMDKIKKMATPKYKKGLSPSQIALAKSMRSAKAADGTYKYDWSDIAERFEVSPSTVIRAIEE